MKQRTKLIIILAAEFIAISIILLLIFFAGKKTYTVTFDLNGGILLSGSLEQRVTQGHNATPPSVAKDGQYLKGWSGNYYKVTSDSTVKAIWEYETTTGIEYSDSENKNYCEIVGSHEYLRGDVYIGSYNNGKAVLGIDEGAFKDRRGITSVHLLDGILSINKEAFSGCEALLEIDLPKTLVSIGEGAFAGCKNLKKITLPDSLESIGAGAFAGCESLEEIELPASLLRVGVGAFDTPGLTVTINDCDPLAFRVFDDGWCTEDVTVIGKEEPKDEESEESDENGEDEKNDWWDKFQ